jgi:nucleotidyltransferase substrate binding protein (TIGR01987 family)
MDGQDIRWKQRFSNFERAYIRLEEAMAMSSLNELERNGLVQRFEFSLEIGWKVMKDFLEDQGFDFSPSPKETFRQAQNAAYIDYAQALIDGLEIRNVLSHDYSGDKFQASEEKLRNTVFPALQKLYYFFLTHKNSSSK